jgi:hypothetical protein
VLKQFAAEFPQETGAALLHVATTKTLPTIKMVTPIDHGFLRAANRVLGPDVAQGYCGITFYNPMEYAAPVHEILTAHHPSGTPKFIEWPLLADLEDYPRAVLERAQQTVGRAVHA